MIEKRAPVNDLNCGTKKTTKVKDNYNIVHTSENGNLLGIRTGTINYSEKPRVEGEEEERRPREQREPREDRKPREPREEK